MRSSPNGGGYGAGEQAFPILLDVAEAGMLQRREAADERVVVGAVRRGDAQRVQLRLEPLD